jgi:hypothetical protein
VRMQPAAALAQISQADFPYAVSRCSHNGHAAIPS